MKILYKYFSLLITLGLLTACGGEGGTDPEPTSFEELISANWSMQSVTVDGTDVTSDFTGFSVVLNSNGKGSNSGSFTISNANGVIDSSGSYTVNGSSGIVLNGSISVSVSLSNENNTMTFAFNNPDDIFSGGRTEGTAGNYTVVLVR